MTLPASLPISMSQIAAELGLSLPLSLQHSWVRALAQVSGAACDFNSLRGKTGRFDGNVSVNGVGVGSLGNSPFFGVPLNALGNQGGQLSVNVNGATPPSYTGSIRVTNNTTGVGAVLAYQGGTPASWVLNSPPPNITPAGISNYSITPSN